MSVASPCSGKRTVGGKEGIHWSTGDLEWGQRVLQLWLKSKDKKNWGKPTLGLGKGKELFTHPHRSWYQAGQVCTQISFVVVFGFRHHSFPESEWWQFVKYPHPWLPLDQNLSRMRLSLLRCLRGVMSQTAWVQCWAGSWSLQRYRRGRKISCGLHLSTPSLSKPGRVQIPEGCMSTSMPASISAPARCQRHEIHSKSELLLYPVPYNWKPLIVRGDRVWFLRHCCHKKSNLLSFSWTQDAYKTTEKSNCTGGVWHS